MNVYGFEVRVAATVYVKASSERVALRKVRALNMCEVCFTDSDEVAVSKARFDEPGMPEVSLSPVGTIWAKGLVEADEIVAEGV